MVFRRCRQSRPPIVCAEQITTPVVGFVASPQAFERARKDGSARPKFFDTVIVAVYCINEPKVKHG